MSNLDKARHYAKYAANFANPAKARTAAWAVSKCYWRLHLRGLNNAA